MLRVDMKKLECEFSNLKSEYEKMGGRSLTSTIVLNEVNPECDPLGPNNKLVIAPGMLAGAAISSAQRLSIGAKSPLTGGIKEANSGGTAGKALGRLGIATIVIEGAQQAGNFYVLYIAKDQAKLVKVNDLKGKGNYATGEWLREKYGSHVSVISIGQAGERLMLAATIAVTDKEGIPSRHAARGGLGAVMGTKCIKAIVLDDAETVKMVSPTDSDLFKRAVKAYYKDIKEVPRVKTILPQYGTSIVVEHANHVGTLPTKNFSSGKFEGADRINGNALVELIESRGGKRSNSCYSGCFIRCSNVVLDSKGKHLTSSLDYETIAMLGSNCGIDCLDTIATLDFLCDDYGLDTIEMGNAVGVAMESGQLSFGNGPQVIEALHGVAKGTLMGRVLGQGSLITGKVLGVKRIPVIKGQAIPAWDPRVTVATGVSMITSPQGADHTAGRMAGVSELDYLKPGEIVPISLKTQIKMCVFDSVGLCMFSDSSGDIYEYVSDILTALYGIKITAADLVNMGKQLLKTELNFNAAAGFTKSDDRLPEWMLSEPVPPTNSVFPVSNEEIDEIFNF